MTDFDLVIRNATIATPADVFTGDIGVVSGRIEAIASSLDAGREEIDAAGRTIHAWGHRLPHPPGAARERRGLKSRTTSIRARDRPPAGAPRPSSPLRSRAVARSLRQALADYRERARGRCFVDYAFHAIITDPTAQVLNPELPSLVRRG